jgi:hypothetical protein
LRNVEAEASPVRASDCMGFSDCTGVPGSAILEALRNAKVGTLTMANIRGPKT